MATLLAGAARVDITPPLGTQIAGDIGHRRAMNEVRDPIYAHALVLENDGKKVCLLSLDLMGVSTPNCTEIRERAAQICGTQSGAVMVHATQSHAAPAVGHFMVEGPTDFIPEELSWLRGGDDAYVPLAIAGVLEAVSAAANNMQPVTLEAVSGVEDRVAFNRRCIMRDGSGRCHPPKGSSQIRYSEGPIDPEVGLTVFRGEDGSAVAALLHFTCHPNHGYPMYYISADWPAVWREGLRELLGPNCVPLVMNGACGNIHHSNPLNANQKDDLQRMGNCLAETTLQMAPQLEPLSSDSLDYRSRFIPVRWRDVDPSVFEAAEELLRANPQPMWKDDEKKRVEWDWAYAVSRINLQKEMQRKPHYDCEVQAFRIGDLALVALPGEPFVEGQLRIKVESPTYPTYVAHLSNQAAGYIPTAAAMARGGYETNFWNWSKLAPEALDQLADTSGELLQELFT